MEDRCAFAQEGVNLRKKGGHRTKNVLKQS